MRVLISHSKNVNSKDLNICFDQWQREHHYDYGDQYGQVFIIKVKSYTKVTDSNHQYVLSNFRAEELGITEPPSTELAIEAPIASFVEGATTTVSMEGSVEDEETKKKRRRRRRRVRRNSQNLEEEYTGLFDEESSEHGDLIDDELHKLTEGEWDDVDDFSILKGHGTSKPLSSIPHEEPTYSLFPHGRRAPLPFHDSQFYPISSPHLQTRINEDKIMRLALTGAMVNLAQEEGLIRQLALTTEPEPWDTEGAESIIHLKNFLLHIFTGALETYSTEAGRIISPPKMNVFEKVSNRSVAKSRIGDKLAINTSLMHKTENTFLYAIIERKNAIREPSRSELVRGLLPDIITKMPHGINLIEWMEVRDFVTWTKAVEEYGFDSFVRPRTVRFTQDLSELVFDTNMHLFFDPKVLDECREKIPSWVVGATELVMQTLVVQRMLSKCVQELFDRIDQDYRLAIPAVAVDEDLIVDVSDSPVQFLLPLSIVDHNLRGTFLATRRRGGYYRAYRLVNREKAYELARPIRKNLFEKEWWNVF